MKRQVTNGSSLKSRTGVGTIRYQGHSTMRWKGSEEQVTSALAIFMILAALVVIASYAWEIVHHAA